jgi:hypothetical protein
MPGDVFVTKSDGVEEERIRSITWPFREPIIKLK